MKLGLWVTNSIKFSTVYKTIALTSVLACLLSCNSNSIKIDNFDAQAWKDNTFIDKNQCISYRKQNFKLLIDNQDLFLGKSDPELSSFLGTPDKESISGHLKKSKMYCIDGCQDCETKAHKRYLVFDFETFKRIKSVRIVVEFN
jgi:hypothetical protein